MKKLLITLLIINAIFAILTMIWGGKSTLLSFEVAFVSSSLIIFSSFKSYENMVKTRVALLESAKDEPDAINKIEDPYQLYDDEDSSSNSIDKNDNIKEILDEEKRRLKSNRDLKKSIKESKSFFAPLKIVSYALLAFGFIFLKREGSLEIFVYLISLAIPIFTAVWVLMNQELKNVKTA